METTEILEGNKLIAEFIGRSGKVRTKLYTFKGIDIILKDDIWYHLEESKFHYSWDWLMPVVEKIESNEFSYECNKQEENDYQSLITEGNNILFQVFDNNRLISTYKVVIEFIKWYNKNK